MGIKLSPSDRRRKVASFSYYVTAQGLTVKEACTILGISERTAGMWLKEHNLKGRMQKLQNEMKANPLKFDESLSAFTAYIRIHKPELYETLLPACKQFLNSL